jgi:hypothetical protein
VRLRVCSCSTTSSACPAADSAQPASTEPLLLLNKTNASVSVRAVNRAVNPRAILPRIGHPSEEEACAAWAVLDGEEKRVVDVNLRGPIRHCPSERAQNHGRGCCCLGALFVEIEECFVEDFRNRQVAC